MAKIGYEIDQGIAQITMDDGKVNAMDSAFFEEMGEALDRAEADGAKTLIITGRPGHFSAGLDVKMMPTLSPGELNRFVETFSRTMLRVFSVPLPTIAVCTGHAVAGGAMLAFSCDLRFAVDGPYRIQMNEMVVGIPFPSWMLLIGRSSVPAEAFMETFLHAKAFSPAEAVERGLFHGLTGEGEGPIEHARAAAEKLKGLNLSAYGTSKRRLREADVERVFGLLKEELPFKGA